MTGKDLANSYYFLMQAIKNAEITESRAQLALKFGLHWMLTRANLCPTYGARNLQELVSECEENLRRGLEAIAKRDVVIFDQDKSELHYCSAENEDGGMISAIGLQTRPSFGAGELTIRKP
jgi:hypothetical protein